MIDPIKAPKGRKYNSQGWSEAQPLERIAKKHQAL
jgi:hypothetical protein